MENKALLVMDYINEIIHPDGKLAGKGYSDFASKNNTLQNVKSAIDYARQNQITTVFVKVGFSHDYKELPKNSLLFGKAKESGSLKLNTWATEFHESLGVKNEDVVFVKHGISPFYETALNSYLKGKNITDLYMCGVATDLVVQSAARDAHDRGYDVYVLSDCCVAAREEDHVNSLNTIKKFAHVGTKDELLVKRQ